jgi:Helix-turn-helix
MTKTDVKQNLIQSDAMRTKAQTIFLRRLNELLPRGRATIIAQRTGIHLSTISNWRQGKTPVNPSLEILEKLANALNVPVAYLITDSPLVAVDASERESLESVLRAHRAMSDELLKKLEALKRE